MNNRYDLQDKTYVSPDVRPVRNIADIVGEKYDKLHGAIKKRVHDYTLPAVQEASDYYNDELYKDHPILAALGSSMVDNVYPLVEDQVTDPINLALVGAGAARQVAKAPEVYRSIRYSPEGWKAYDAVQDLVKGRTVPVYTPNYSRPASSVDVIYRAGEDATKAALGAKPGSVPPISISTSPVATEVTNGIPYVNNGNHRMIIEREAGYPSLGEDRTVIASHIPTRKRYTTDIEAQQEWPRSIEIDPEATGPSKLWFEEEINNPELNKSAGMRIINVKDVKDASGMSTKDLARYDLDRAKAMDKAMEGKTLPEMLYKMSDGYPYIYDKNSSMHKFFGNFIPDYVYDGGQMMNVNREYNGINPFLDLKNAQDLQLPIKNPVLRWIQEKLPELQELSGGDPSDLIDQLATGQPSAHYALGLLDSKLAEDYAKFLTSNGITLRPRAGWGK